MASWLLSVSIMAITTIKSKRDPSDIDARDFTAHCCSHSYVYAGMLLHKHTENTSMSWKVDAVSCCRRQKRTLIKKKKGPQFEKLEP